jgi:hypothetical protein
MKIQHPPSHWVTVALVTAAALLTITEASGQAGAGTAFEGRPSMAGANGGLGAMAGPPQGGIGLQGSEGSRLQLRRSLQLSGAPGNMPQGAPATPPAAVAAVDAKEVRGGELAPAQRDRDPGVAKKQRSTSDKIRRSAKRTTEGARYGVSPIDTR